MTKAGNDDGHGGQINIRSEPGSLLGSNQQYPTPVRVKSSELDAGTDDSYMVPGNWLDSNAELRSE